MQLLLQVWGGLFFLLNKVFFWRSENATSDEVWRRQRILAWSVYLLGLAPWLVIFFENLNWIAFAVEAGGVPSMFVGLVLAAKYGRNATVPWWLDIFALIGVCVGGWYSFQDFGGLTTVNQYLELALAGGFLYGVYRLAKDRVDGYFGFMLMNAANAGLMGLQDKWFLVVQQIVSLAFVIAAYRVKKGKAKESS